ncbi:MAG: hypothetical protein KJ725_01125 [Gammaproteobacteria bacterium]|nr:hypothetical protein [Gammaproteobacteria bacterium]
MALAQEDLIEIQRLIDQSIAARPELVNANVRYELELRERIVRVEEELKHQRELMMQGFEMTQKRFEQVDKRFEQIDKRFDEMLKRHDRHFLWLVGFIVSCAGLTIAAVRFF